MRVPLPASHCKTKTITTTTSSTTNTTLHSSSFAAATTRALRVVHHKHAAKIAAQARIVRLHAPRLLNMQREIDREAAAIAGAAYKEYHDVVYDEYGSMESQRAIDNGAIRGPGIVNVVELASSIATYAVRVAAAAVPPPLPYE
jgi:hypothetical protein